VSSRRRAEELISAGKVRVNGELVRTLGTRVDPKRDRIEVGGKAVVREEKALYLFHKPRQVVSTLSDPHGRRSIKDYLKKSDKRLYPIGRLDYDVSGLLLLTNDGDFMERMLHPRYASARVYWVEVRGVVSKNALSKLTKAVQLEDGVGRADKASLLAPSSEVNKLLGTKHEAERFTLLEITVSEGRNHFVKRLLSAIGHPVTRMSRVQFAQFALGTLSVGEMKLVPFPKLI